jgi:hypothetical protein
MTEAIAGSLLFPSLGKRGRAEEEKPGETGPTAVLRASVEIVGRRTSLNFTPYSENE